MKLSGKVALVTGAARGLGRAHSLRLASLGADVIVNDIDLEAAKKVGEELTAENVVEEIKAMGQHSIGIQADVSDKKAVDAMFQRILEEFGRLDILVNNAGGFLIDVNQSYASTTPEAAVRFTLDVNLMSTIFCCQAASIPMKAQKSGKIVNTASVLGLGVDGISSAGPGGPAPYGVAKAAIIAYTRYLAVELAPYNINVNCIAPGLVPTARVFARGQKLGTLDRALERIPMHRFGKPEDIAKAVEFLCTDLSDYVTGHCLPVDGGVTLY